MDLNYFENLGIGYLIIYIYKNYNIFKFKKIFLI